MSDPPPLETPRSIYVIQNRLDLKIYVGQTDNPKRRWIAHKSCAKSGKDSYLYNAIRKYGVENFTFTVIEEQQSVEDCDAAECLYIALFESHRRSMGYNLAPGGSVNLHTEETKAKISAAKQGNRHSAETKAKLSAAAKGRKLSEEHKAKIGAAGKGRKQSEETRAKKSSANKGKKRSSETKAKISAARKCQGNQANRERAREETPAKICTQLSSFRLGDQ